MENKLCLLLLVVAGTVLAIPGDYIPKSYYFLNSYGQKSEVHFIRNKRDLQIPLLSRMKRGGGGGSQPSAHSTSYASSGAGGGAGGGGYGGGGDPIFFGDFIPDIDQGFAPGLDSIRKGVEQGLRDVENAVASANHGAGGAGHGKGGSNAFASSWSSSSSGHPGQGGGIESRSFQGGNDGPQIYSRFGEGKGSGIKVSGSAQGPHGAFSSSSSSSDGQGNVKYSVKSGKY